MFIHLAHTLIRHRYHQLGLMSEFMDSESCRLHFIRRTLHNASRDVVLLHGLGTSSSTWIHILPALKNLGTISCLDLPGYGFSKITSGEPFFSLRQMDRAIEQFIRDTQHGPIILIGHSLGGWLAARYAVAHPRSVRHLILINNAGIKYDGFEQQAELFRFRDVDDVRRLLQKMWYRYPWYFKPFASSIYKSLKQKQIDQFVHSINDEDLLNRSFKSLHLPIDILWGANDGLISNTSVEIMKQLAPQAKEHFIPECGHVPQLERPRELIHVLTAVLTSL